MRDKALQSTKKILLIDDDSDTSLSTALQQDGYEFISCDSAEKAWDLVLPHRPHCVIVHLGHPTKAGNAILQECHALAAGVPVIVAAPIYWNEAVMQALEAGATAILPLPPKPGIIKKLLRELKSSTN